MVTKYIPNNSLAVGNPCKVIGKYDEYMEKQKNRMNEDNIFDKFPKDLTEEEIEMLVNKINSLKENMLIILLLIGENV